MARDNDKVETSELSCRHLPPEIVRLVLEHLKGDKTFLRPAILVNRAWTAEGISILRRYSFEGGLLLIEGGHRRQYYASQVRTLIARGTNAQHEVFRSLKFPKLKCVILELDRYGGEVTRGEMSVSQYLQPNLEIFNFSDGVLAADSFALLESQCPQLKMLGIWRMPEEMESNRLVKFLENCGSLERIALYWNKRVGEPTDDQVFTQLAGRDGLLGLRMSRPIRYGTLKTAFDTI